jgi:hypothetical protein
MLLIEARVRELHVGPRAISDAIWHAPHHAPEARKIAPRKEDNNQSYALQHKAVWESQNRDVHTKEG